MASKKVVLTIKLNEIDEDPSIVRLHTKVMDELQAQPGDIIYVCDKRWWLGGLKSVHVRAGEPVGEDKLEGYVLLSQAAMDKGGFKEGDKVKVEKII